jgi:hypothetical protein
MMMLTIGLKLPEMGDWGAEQFIFVIILKYV